MVDTTSAKRHLDATQNTLNSINKIEEINRLIEATALNLTSVLGGTDHELYIDSETITKLETIRKRLDSNQPTHLTHDIKQRYDIYDGRVTALGRNATPEDRRKRSLYEEHLTDVAAGTSNTITTRFGEYGELLTEAAKFNLAGDYTAQTVRLDTGASVARIGLNTFCITIPPSPENELCDEHGTPLVKRGSNWEINIDGTTYTLSGITYNATTGEYIFSNMKVNPSNIDISKPLKLSITAKYPTSFGINVACNKPFQLNLSEGGPANTHERENEIDAYNTSIAGTNIVEEHLQNKFESERDQIIEEAIKRSVSKINSPIFDALTDGQKKEFYNRIRNQHLPHASAGGNTEFVPILEEFNDYDTFKIWFAADNKSWNKNANNTRTQKAYRQYFHDHFRDESKKFFEEKLDNILNNIDNETFIKSQLSNYLIEIEGNKIDNATIRDTIETRLERDNVRMDRKRWWQVFRNRDDNFMRFFSLSSKEIKNQNIDLASGPIKYDMKLIISENNKLGVDIKIDGQETISLQSGDYDPTTLARRILREPSIPTSKAKVHMVYNLYRGLLQIAKDKNIKLEYFQPGAPGEMRELKLANNGNIILKAVQYGTTPPYSRTSTTLFDEQLFQNTNQFNDNGNHNSLEEGILGIASHFTYAMNRMHRDYNRGTKRIIHRAFLSRTKTNLPISFWTSPIRKILNLKNTANFDFSTNVGNTRIELKGNTFTFTTPDSPKPIVSKNLGKILDTRVNKRRIFDGKERDIVEAVYSNLTKKMRENSKIARTNFGVVDDLTGNVYILDSTGNFGRINRDALDGANMLHRFWGFKAKCGVISEKKLRGSSRRPGFAYHRLTSTEEKELLKNPLLMEGFVRAMNRRMGLVESIRAWFDRH